MIVPAIGDVCVPTRGAVEVRALGRGSRSRPRSVPLGTAWLLCAFGSGALEMANCDGEPSSTRGQFPIFCVKKPFSLRQFEAIARLLTWSKVCAALSASTARATAPSMNALRWASITSLIFLPMARRSRSAPPSVSLALFLSTVTAASRSDRRSALPHLPFESTSLRRISTRIAVEQLDRQVRCRDDGGAGAVRYRTLCRFEAFDGLEVSMIDQTVP